MTDFTVKIKGWINSIMLYMVLRHQSIKMTERYAHLLPDVKQDAVNQLAGLVKI